MNASRIRNIANRFNRTEAAPYGDDDPPHRVNGSSHRGNGVQTNEAAARTKNRFAVFNAFIDVAMRTVSTTEAAVWFVLYRETKPNGVAKVSQRQIAEAVGVDERTVRRAIDRLRDLGLIEVARRGGIGRGPSSYRVFGVSKT